MARASDIEFYLNRMDDELLACDGSAEISHDGAKQALRDVYLLSCGEVPEHHPARLIGAPEAEQPDPVFIAQALDAAHAEIKRLRAIINRPENNDFIRGVSIEAEHQAQRWGDDHDSAKSGWDWFWTIGYLSQKAAMAFEVGDFDKAKHHCVSTAALMSNMHKFVLQREVQNGGNDGLV